MKMNILFQGGWKKDRDLLEEKKELEKFSLSFAMNLINSDHRVILTTPRYYDLFIANEIERLCKKTGKNPKDYITFLLSDRFSETPTIGRVIKFPKFRWWLEERAFFVRKADLVVAIGGGKGTADSIYKGFTMGRPVFVARITDSSRYAWYQRPTDYHYLELNDAEFIEDINISADEFFNETFRIIDMLVNKRYNKRIFIVHGRDHHTRDKLVGILKRLEFEPIVLEREPSKGLTIIEKLEEEADNVGFTFVIYTPDDLGKISGGEEENRARQNVVFEHGLLIGVLGRERVCALICGNIKMPSDLQGLIYERINEIEREAVIIARILSNAGYLVNAGRLVDGS